MDKKAAAAFLGVTTRTIENYAKTGKLSVVYMAGKATYKPEELKALKQELETPVHRAMVAVPNESEDIVSESFGGIAKAEGIAELVEAFIFSHNLWRKLIWSLDEAATASGYSRFHLRSAIALGNLKAKKVGRGWKVRPQDLERYTNWLFEDGHEESTTQNRHRMAGLQN